MQHNEQLKVYKTKMLLKQFRDIYIESCVQKNLFLT